MSEQPKLVKVCANCLNYSWGQPSEQGSILLCSKCKFMRYCSKECQQEHWLKVHKHHCKYLANQKVMPQSRHDSATCPGCMDQSEAGPVEMTNEDNPILLSTILLISLRMVFSGPGKLSSSWLTFFICLCMTL